MYFGTEKKSKQKNPKKLRLNGDGTFFLRMKESITYENIELQNFIVWKYKTVGILSYLNSTFFSRKFNLI